MPKQSRNLFAVFGFALIFVVAVSLACQINLGGSEVPEVEVPVTTEAVEDLKENVGEQVQNAQEGQAITLTFDESQLTSLLAFELESQSDPIITEPQVFLRDGLMEVYGQASTGMLEGQVHLSISAAVNEQGEPILEISSAEIGSVPVPAPLLETFSTVLDESFTSNLGSSVTGFQIEAIDVQDGLLVVTGQVR